MKILTVLFTLFMLGSLAKSQGVPNPIELKRTLPPVAKDEEYFGEGMEELKRRNNVVFKIVAPAEAEKEKFRDFLAQPKTGIIRLLIKKECAESSPKRPEELLNYGKKCPTSYLQGGGANFSFRKKAYVDDNQSDITFKNGLIYSNGLINQALMIDLRNMPIENVNLEIKELEFLKNYKPEVLAEEVDKQISAIEEGINVDGLLYKKGFKASENSTFALRVVAYKADLSSHYNSSGIGITFDPLHKDIRDDIIVVFKIFNFNDDGITMVWRELQRKKSPQIKLKK